MNRIKHWESIFRTIVTRITTKTFFIKIQKMETKLNVWLSRDLTLMGRTLLVKALGISKIVHSASMLCVPEEVIKRVQEKLFSDLWRNKKDKIERTVMYQTPCRGDLNFPNVRTTVKAFRLSWIGRLLSESSEAWKESPVLISIDMEDYRFS